MKLQWSLRAAIAALLFAWLGSSFPPGDARAQLGLSFSGRATGLNVRVATTGSNVAIADTGPLPASGGGLGAALLSANIPRELTAGIVELTAAAPHAAIVGLDRTRAEASLANLNLTVSGNGITAEFLMARSSAGCGAEPAVAGSSQLADLVINGQSVTITGQPNQTIALPNGTAIINEQLSSVTGSSGRLIVNALHVTTSDLLTGQRLADVVIAAADAGAQCDAGFASNFVGLSEVVYAQSQPTNFASGGGWIPAGVGKATFGFFAGTQEDGTLNGHVVYVDHDANFSMESTSITAFTAAACSSTIEGEGTSNGTSVHFIVTVTDNGEPGSQDTFKIDVTNVYSNAATLAGGNVQADGSWAGGRVLAHGRTCP